MTPASWTPSVTVATGRPCVSWRSSTRQRRPRRSRPRLSTRTGSSRRCARSATAGSSASCRPTDPGVVSPWHGRVRGGPRRRRAPSPVSPRGCILHAVKLIQANGVLESLARVDQPQAPPVRVALVQHEWVDDPSALVETLRDGIRTAAEAGARVVFLPELTFSRYPADSLPEGTPSEIAEELETGPTVTFARAA